MTIKSILQSLNITPKNTLFTLLFFTGLYLSVLEIELYRKTFIPLSIPLLIWILTGLFITPFFLKTLPDYLKTEIFIYQIAFNTITWGGIVTYLFMALNCYGARADNTSATLIATGSGYLAKGRYGCGEPYKEVYYSGLNKVLIFPCGTTIEETNTVTITLNKGLFNYDVIVDQKLSK
ncbi:hypothetical protein SAMN05216464_11614 [Mucilaginibacter pineti]|uniref:Uncharacterized protein n=1 Tax=Mucilaginibacter pineti TaxID=1391627 RepID=A0A1G7K7I8_9SPHI|nr:hypothetical protein [Mucilaginibacter pineti]SDF32829.1 hypothetical protein SAMN05216464_11614 [Mucilaginibacter pineti]